MAILPPPHRSRKSRKAATRVLPRSATNSSAVQGFSPPQAITAPSPQIKKSGSGSTPSSPNGAVPAHKASKTTTSYQSGGVNDPNLVQPTLDSELGSSIGTKIQETVPDLASPFQRLTTYTKMMNDAGVDVSMRVQKTPVVGADYYIEPYSDDPLDVEIGQFIWQNLDGGLEAPLINSLEDIVHFFEDGYSTLEKVYGLRTWTPPGQGKNGKQYTMLEKLAVRPPSTHKQIVYDDNGTMTQIIQSAVRANGSVEDVTIPFNKLLTFTFGRTGGDMTGKSLLRTAYPHWFYKTHFYKIDAIQKERHSLGIPKGKLMPGYNAQDKIILRQLLRNLRTNEEAFMLLTPNVDIEFAKVEGNLVDVLASASHHNTMILLNVMAAFLAVADDGSSNSTRAGGGTQADLMMKALKYIANYICDVINMYLIPELVVWNYPTTNFPKLKVRNIGETRDLQMLGSALSNLITCGGIMVDKETENWIRGTFDMPKRYSDNGPFNIDVFSGKGDEPNSTDGTAGAPAAPGGGGTNGQKGSTKPSGGQNGKPVNAPQ